MEKLLALDSVRSKDADGMLHVDVSNISKSNISPYYGKEIPGYKDIGLNPNKIYKLYRAPEELAKAVDTFNGKPVLRKHIPFDVYNPPKSDVVGYMGTDAAFDGIYLKNSLHFHDAAMIAAIETNEQRELSPGYRYRADMTTGEVDGEHYDGVMRDIACNHLAVVEVGRTGSDVTVFDELPQEMKMSEKLKKRLEALKPLLAQDADIEEVKKIITEDEDDDKKAKDSEPDKKASAKDVDPDDGKKKAEDEDDKKKPAAKDEGDKDKPAMDASLIAQDAENRAMAKFKAIREAERAVRPVVGDVAAMDSADEVYHFALDAMNVTDHKTLSGDALKTLFNAVNQAKSEKIVNPTMAQDSSTRSTLADLCPNLKK